MFSRLSTQVRSYLTLANASGPAGDAGTQQRVGGEPPGRHPVVIALDASAGGRPPWRQCVFGRFGDLPDHVLAQIAHYVTLDGLTPWSRICRQAFALLRPEQLWHRLPNAISGVVSLAMLGSAVRDIEQWSMPRASHWLATLARRLPLLDGATVQQGFTLLLEAAQRLPPSRQGPVLEALAAARARCAVPDAPCRIGLALEQRLYQAACALAQDGCVQTFCVVVSHCSYDLAQSRSPTDWDATVRGLPEPCRALALVALLTRLDFIWQAATNEKAWTDRVTLASELPPQDRDLGLIALAVPNSHLRAAEARRRFEMMLPLAPALPPQQQPGLYAALACLTMAMPERHVPAAWSQLMSALPALDTTGAAIVVPYLYGALACMPAADQHARLQTLQQYLRSTMPDMRDVGFNITGAARSELHWQVGLAVRGTQYWIYLPPERDETVVQFLRAQRVIVPAAPLAPERVALMPSALQAHAIECRVAQLQNLGNKSGFSLDADTTEWDALLESVLALPMEVQRAPLAALGSAVARSVALYNRRVFVASMGIADPGPSPVTAAWDKLALAAQGLPMADQIDLAMKFAPHVRSVVALNWISGVTRRAPTARKAEVLFHLALTSAQDGNVLAAKLWAYVFEQSLSLPRLPRQRILSVLQKGFPTQSITGWDRTTARRRLTAALETVQGES